MNQDTNLVHSGTIIGFVPDNPDFAIITDGTFTVHVYIPQTGTQQPQVGQSFQVYKQNNTYYLGTQIQRG